VMTVPERLSADLVSIQPSLRRAPTRNAEVRPSSDHYCHDAPSKAQNKIRISPCNRSPRSSNRRSPTLHHPQAICRPLKSHR